MESAMESEDADGNIDTEDSSGPLAEVHHVRQGQSEAQVASNGPGEGIAMCTSCGLEKCVPDFEYCSGCTRRVLDLYKQNQQKPPRPKPRKNVRLIRGIDKAMGSSLNTEEIDFLSELLPEEIRGDGKEMLEVIRGYKMSANPKNKSRKKEEIVTKLIHLFYGYKTPAIIITENEWMAPVMLKQQIERYSDDLEAIHPKRLNYLLNGLKMIQTLLKEKSVKYVKRTSKNAESVVCMKVDTEYMKIMKKMSTEDHENLSDDEECFEDGDFEEEESEKDASLSLSDGGDEEDKFPEDVSSSAENAPVQYIDERDPHGLGGNNSMHSNWETSSQHSNSGGGKKHSSGSSGSQESPKVGMVPSADTVAPASPTMGAAFDYLATSHNQPTYPTRGKGQGGSRDRGEDYSTKLGESPIEASSRGPVYPPRGPAQDPAAPAIVRIEPHLPVPEFNRKTNDFPVLPGTSNIANTVSKKQDKIVDPRATPWESRPRKFLENQQETILVMSETDKRPHEYESSLSRFMTPINSQGYVADVTKLSGLVSTPLNFITQKGLRVHLPTKRRSADTNEQSSANCIESPPRTSSPKLNLNNGGNKKENAIEDVCASPTGSPSSDFNVIGHQIVSHQIAHEVVCDVVTPPNSHYQGDDRMLVKGSSIVQDGSTFLNIEGSSEALGSEQVMVPGTTVGFFTGVEKINGPQVESGRKRGLSQNMFTFSGDVEPNGDDSNDTEEKEFKFKFLKTSSTKSKVKKIKKQKSNNNGVRGERTNIRGRAGKGGGGSGLAPVGECFPKLGFSREDAQGPQSVFTGNAKDIFDIKPRSKASPSPSYQASRFKSVLGNKPENPRVVKSALPSMLHSPVMGVAQEAIVLDKMVDRCSQSPKLNAVSGAPEAINEVGVKGEGTSMMVTARKNGGGVRSGGGGPPGGSGKGSSKAGCGQGNAQEPSSVFPNKKSKGTTSLLRLYEIDSDPERHKFLDELLDFMQKRSTPIVRCPILGQKPVDLFRLYLNIKGRGGFTQCNKSWKNIAEEVGISQNTNVAYSLKKIYERDLLPFENIAPCSLNLSDLSSKESQVFGMEIVSPGIPTQGKAKETASNVPLIQYVGDTSVDINRILNLSQKE